MSYKEGWGARAGEKSVLQVRVRTVKNVLDNTARSTGINMLSCRQRNRCVRREMPLRSAVMETETNRVSGGVLSSASEEAPAGYSIQYRATQKASRIRRRGICSFNQSLLNASYARVWARLWGHGMNPTPAFPLARDGTHVSSDTFCNLPSRDSFHLGTTHFLCDVCNYFISGHHPTRP